MSSTFLSPGLPQTALVVIDVQKAFIDPSFLEQERSTPNLEPNITALLAAFRSKSLPVIHIHHVETIGADGLVGLWNEQFHPEGVLPQDYVVPHPGEPVLRKYNKSSGFTAHLVTDKTTTLKDLLDAQGIRTVVIVGLSSPHCVASTARGGYDNGLSVVVVGDACATYGETPVPNYSGAVKGDAKSGKAWSVQTTHDLAMGHLITGELAEVVGTDAVLKFA